MFADVFEAKSKLDDAEVNDFSAMSRLDSLTMGDGFLPVRRRYARSVLKDLKENSGTGPDLLAARVLRRCCRSVLLEVPLTLLARAMLSEGRWPIHH